MGRKNNNQPRHKSRKPDKKQMRKKQAALVQRCVELLNSNAEQFRAKLSNPPSTTKPTTGSLKHFKPIRIETVGNSALANTAALLESKFSLKEVTPSKEQES